MVLSIVGVVGGSGIQDIDALSEVETKTLDTPFGAPSGDYVMGRLGDVQLVFLPRHGRSHRLLPHEINYRANIHGFKQLGVQWLISLSAVGSMRAGIRPGDIVIVDQFIDQTRRRNSTFFGDGIAAHVAFGDPISTQLATVLFEAACAEVDALNAKVRVHASGTYLCIDGPQFSTRAESNLYRRWGVDVIGMTNMPEAKLAREAELSYATVALVTDYDAWRASKSVVSVGAVLDILRQNAKLARRVLMRAVRSIPQERTCSAATALAAAIVTHSEGLSSEARRRLDLLVGRYLP